MGAVRSLRPAVRDRVLECCQSSAGANGAPRIRAGRTLRVGSNHRGASPFALGGKHGAVRKRSAGGPHNRRPDGGRAGPLCVALLGARRRHDSRFQPGVDWDRPRVDGCRFPGLCSAAALFGCVAWLWTNQHRSARRGGKQPAAAHFRRYANHSLIPAACRGWCADEDSVDAGKDATAIRHRQCSGGEFAGDVVWANA